MDGEEGGCSFAWPLIHPCPIKSCFFSLSPCSSSALQNINYSIKINAKYEAKMASCCRMGGERGRGGGG